MKRALLGWVKYWRYRMIGVTCLSPDVPLFGGSIEPHVRIDTGAAISKVRIGRYSYIGEYCKIGYAEIGPFCSIAAHSAIGLGNHPTEFVSSHTFCYLAYRGFVEKDLVNPYEKGPSRLGPDVWLGFGAQVMTGVTIGTGAILGSGSIATKDIPPYAIAVGVPAEVKRYRFDEETRQALLESEWWKWTDAQLRERIHLFQSPREFIEFVQRTRKPGETS